MKKNCKLFIAIVALCLVAFIFAACGDQTTDCEKNGHTWNEGVVTKEANCTEKGVKTFTCSVCDETKTEDIEAKGHTEVVDAAVPATCTATGKTEGKHCSVCDTVLVEQTVVEKLAHTEVVDAAVPATCSVKGKTEGSHCSVCNAVIVAQNEIPTIAHTFVAGVEIAPTCTEEGKKAANSCSVCGYVEGGESIPAAGHVFVNIPAVEATCNAPGRKAGRYCSVCAYKELGKQTIMLRHVAVEVKEKEATCLEAGNTAGKVCKYCGEWLEGKVIPKNDDHTPIDDPDCPAVAATCGQPGKTARQICKFCKVLVKEPTDTEPLGHTQGTEIPATEATCEGAGMTSGYSCGREGCTDYYLEPTEDTAKPALGHTGGTATTTKLAVCTRCEKAYGNYLAYADINFSNGGLSDSEGKVGFTNHNGTCTTTTVSHNGNTAEVDALVLAKQGDYVDCTFTDITTAANMEAFVKKGFTVEAFYVLKDKTGSQGVICAAATVSNVNGGWGIAEKNTGKPYFITGKGGKNGWASADTTTTVSTTELVHVVGVFDNSSNKVKIYVNGEFKAEAATGGNFKPLAGTGNFNMFCLGAGKGSTAFASKGMVMVDAKIYESALNADQAKMAYDQAVVEFGLN